MGYHENVTADSLPKQGGFLHKRVVVFFSNCNAINKKFGGLVVRDDGEPPYRMIIRLDDGRHVMSTECLFAVEEKCTPCGGSGKIQMNCGCEMKCGTCGGSGEPQKAPDEVRV